MTPLKMRNHDAERNAAEYVSGELGGRRVRRWFDAHLLDCEDCWREVVLGRLGRRLATDFRDPAPSTLRERVRAMVVLESGRVADRPRRRLLRWKRSR
ncbi:MAG: hypothetical protein WD739_11230 [Actinomycetota bacterium]